MPDFPTWLKLVIAMLATWRVAHLVAHEDGPFDIVVRLRRRAGDGVLGKLMDCPYCLSLWIAVPFALWMTQALPDWGATWLAISGGAVFLERCAIRPGSS